MRIFKIFFAILSASLFLAACGGGGSTEAERVAEPAVGSSTSTEPALMTAYKEITVGMTLDQVQEIIGTGYKFEYVGLDRMHVQWTLGVFQEPNSITLQVSFTAGRGASYKSIQIIHPELLYVEGTCAATYAVRDCQVWIK